MDGNAFRGLELIFDPDHWRKVGCFLAALALALLIGGTAGGLVAWLLMR